MDWNWFWDHTLVGALLFQFVFLIALFAVGRLIAWALWYVIPPGKIKTALYRRQPD